MSRLLAPILLLAALAGAAPAQFDSFDDFAWTFEGEDGASGTLTADLMHVDGPDDGHCGSQHWAAFTTVAPWSGTVRVHLEFAIFDLCHFDWPVYVVNGVATQVWVEGSELGCWFDGPRDLTFDVAAGDTFGLGVGSADCWKGPGVTDWTGFSFQPRDWPDAGGALDPRFRFEVQPAGFASDYAATLASPGDVDGDGEADVALRFKVPGPGLAFSVAVVSGADGHLLWSRAEASAFGQAMAAPGDVNGDGVPDLVASLHAEETVRMLSGSDGSILWSATSALFDFGRGLAAFGDATGDGILDIGVSAYPAPGTPITVLSGADGSPVASFAPPPGVGGYAWALAAAGDTDGDGTGDLLATPFAAYGEIWTAVIVSGARGSVLDVLEPPLISLTAWALAAAGDTDGDGTPDVAIGGSDEFGGGLIDPGFVALYSGDGGPPLLTIPGTADDDEFGKALAGGLDVDQDGVPELAVGAPRYHTPYDYSDTGRAVIVRVSDGSIAQEFVGQELDSFGSSLQVLAGPDGTALAIGAPHLGSGVPGRMAVYEDLDHAAGAARLAVHGAIDPGMPWLASIEDGLPWHVALLVIGTAQADLPFKGGVMVPSLDLVLVERLDATGSLGLAGHWPPGSDPAQDLWVQAWLVDPAGPQGWSATQARRSPPP